MAAFFVCVRCREQIHRGQRGQHELVGEDAVAVGHILALRVDAGRAALLPQPRV